MIQEKIAVVTGASRGIGKAIALKLASMDMTVIVNYAGSKEKAENVVKEIEEKGGRAEAVQCDVADFAQCQRMIEDVHKRYGSIDVFVNNAGITRDGLVMVMKEEDFDDVIATNLKGTFYMIKGVYPLFLKQKSGKIINISSVSGLNGNAGQANYSASKAGVVGLTKSVAKELASRGICCNAIAPGFIATDMTETFTGNDALKDAIPMKRFGTPEDVAKLALFLASAESDYITGEVLRIDGGMAM